MKSLRTDKNPGSRIDVGNAVLASAQVVTSEAITPHLQKFQKLHASFLAAHDRVAKADSALQFQARAVGEADAAQDAALMALANALVADGLPRANPFKPLGFDAPSTLARIGYEREAQQAQRLAKAVLNRSGVSKPTIAAAKALAAAAQAVEKQLAPISRLTEARTAAIRARDTLGLSWEAQLARLKLAAQMAEADGERDLYASLFAYGAPPRAKRRKSEPPQTPPAI